MARFRPSLLDTLLAGSLPVQDETAPAAGSVFPGIQLYSLDRMSEAAFLDTLRRDLSWLLNTIRLEDTLSLKGAPEVATSVLNYGIPDFSVRTVSSVDVFEASASIASAVRSFEPRINPVSLAVRGEKTLTDGTAQSVVFNISCDIGPGADARHADFKTEIDVETGDARLEQRR